MKTFSELEYKRDLYFHLSVRILSQINFKTIIFPLEYRNEYIITKSLTSETKTLF